MLVTREKSFCLGLICVAMVFIPLTAAAQRGAKVPTEHASQEPVNHLPNPYETVREFGELPDGRSWGSVSAINIDVDGTHIWAADRCGTNSCAESDVDPIVKMDQQGNVVASFGAGLITWPHGNADYDPAASDKTSCYECSPCPFTHDLSPLHFLY